MRIGDGERCFVALSIFDYCLTYAEEKRLIWQRRVSLTTFLFMAGRHVLFIQNIALVVQISRAKYGDTDSIDWVSKRIRSRIHCIHVFLRSDVEC